MSGSRTRSSVVWWGKCHTYTRCSDRANCAIISHATPVSQTESAAGSATTSPDPEHHSALRSIYSWEKKSYNHPILQCVAGLFWKKQPLENWSVKFPKLVSQLSQPVIYTSVQVLAAQVLTFQGTHCPRSQEWFLQFPILRELGVQNGFTKSSAVRSRLFWFTGNTKPSGNECRPSSDLWHFCQKDTPGLNSSLQTFLRS